MIDATSDAPESTESAPVESGDQPTPADESAVSEAPANAEQAPESEPPSPAAPIPPSPNPTVENTDAIAAWREAQGKARRKALEARDVADRVVRVDIRYVPELGRRMELPADPGLQAEAIARAKRDGNRERSDGATSSERWREMMRKHG